MPKQPFHERVAQRLIEQLKEGTAPWQRPWADGPSEWPHSGLTGKDYRGFNTMWLLAQGREDPRWLTYRQASEMGAQVRKGESGTTVVYWQFHEERIERTEDGMPVLKDGEPVKTRVALERPKVFYATVFNAEQIDGMPPLEKRQRQWNPIERAQLLLDQSGANIEHRGNRAYYAVGTDKIRLPPQEQFDSAERYYDVALHELGHWTGAQSRLGRDLTQPHGSAGYAREELRTEIASMLVSAELGLPHDGAHHASYVGHWVKALQDDPFEIFRASRDAQSIGDYVFGLRRELDQQQQSSQAQVAAAATKQGDGDMRLLDVPYGEREEAKKLGARWNRQLQSWFIPAGVDAAPLARWERSADAPARSASIPNSERLYLAVPYDERKAAQAVGAKWDTAATSWYVPQGTDEALIARWLPNAQSEQLPAADPREEFRQAMLDIGLRPGEDHPRLDGGKHRVAAEGDKRGEKSGFYFGFLDGLPAGFMKNHRTGAELRWKAKGYVLSPDKAAQLRAHADQLTARRQRKQEEVYERSAERIAQQLESFSVPTEPPAYNQAKGIDLHPGTFVDDKGTLCVPAIDAEGKMWTAQYIRKDGTKRFAKHSRQQGCFHVLGGLESLSKVPVLVIAEGYATAATARELLGTPTVAAFNAANVEHVGKTLQEKYPNKPVLIVGDDDRHLQTNPGRRCAERAARELGGKAVFPLFAPKEQDDKLTDFNDLATKSVLGRESAAAQLKAAYRGLQEAHRQQRGQMVAAQRETARGR